MVLFPEDRPQSLILILGSDAAGTVWGTLQRLEAPVENLYVEAIDSIEPNYRLYPVLPYGRIEEDPSDADSWTFEARSTIGLGSGAAVHRIVRVGLQRLNNYWAAFLQSVDQVGKIDHMMAEIILPNYRPDIEPVVRKEPKESKSAWDRLGGVV